MKITSRRLSLFLGPLFSLLVTGCTTLSFVEDFSPSEELGPGQALSPFSDSKIRIAQTLVGKEDWIIIIDNLCAAREEKGLAHELHAQFAMSDMERQAYRVAANRASSEDLKAEDCILGASLEVPIRTFSLPKPKTTTLQTAQHTEPAIDPLSHQQQHLDYLGFFKNLEKIRSTTIDKDRRPIIAIVDTGVDSQHEDLKDVMWTDSQGHHGRDLVQGDNEPQDGHGHGTHVAGLAAAASENGIGITGIGRAQIMAVRVLDNSGSTTTDVVTNGILWAADHGADVINLSLGGQVKEFSPALQEAIAYAANKNIFIVAAAGNDGLELSDSFRMEPAGFAKDIKGMVSVGSVDTERQMLSEFSNFSGSYVEILAPGAADSAGEKLEGLLSTVPGDPKYSRMAGTSMATPIVAGAVAVIISKYRLTDTEYTASDIEDELRGLGRPEDSLKNYSIEGRVLDLNRLNSR